MNYSRTFSSADKWQALYVPFSIPIDTLDKYGLQVAELNDTHMYDTDDDGNKDAGEGVDKGDWIDESVEDVSRNPDNGTADRPQGIGGKESAEAVRPQRQVQRVRNHSSAHICHHAKKNENYYLTGLVGILGIVCHFSVSSMF